MFTIFHLLQFIGITIGFILGIKVGYENFGWIGLLIGAVVGVITGFILGNMPFWIGLAYIKSQLKRSSSELLKEQLKIEKFIPHLIKAELFKRGELSEEK